MIIIMIFSDCSFLLDIYILRFMSQRDGQRFSNEFTLKMTTESKYRCTITIKPSIPLQSVSVQSSLVNLIDTTKQNGSCTYEFEWSSEQYTANKNKKRTNIPITLKFQDGLSVSLPIQVKFYSPDNKQHLQWGTQLHFIDYNCSIKPERTSITIDTTQCY